MPYLRLYSPDLPMSQKRVIAQKLIEITLRAFHLPAEDRRRITVQFVPLPELCALPDLRTCLPSDADSTLEVNDRDLTEDKIRDFAAEVVPMLEACLSTKPRGRIARLLRWPNAAQQIAVQFHELGRANATKETTAPPDVWFRAA